MRPVRMRRFAPPSPTGGNTGRYFLHQELMRIDPSRLHACIPRDEVKIVRALEVHHLSGRRLSDVQQRHGFAEQPFSVLMIGPNRDRAQLYQADRRTGGINVCARRCRGNASCWRRDIGAILVR